MKFFYLLLSVAFLFSSCASKPVGSEAEKILLKGDHRIGTYVSSWKGFRTSSYWIEGPEGLILIDTQFLPSAAEEMVNWAEAETGKKAVYAIILHPNPDKFNGTSVFQKRGIKVVTSEQVLKQIPKVHELRKGWFFDQFKPDYPSEEPKPESFGNATTELKAAGLTLKAHILGKGCSETHVVVEFEKNVFVGDLVTIGFHSWLEQGYLKEWLARLAEIKNLKPEYVRTGRGGTGDKDSVEREEAYLKTVISIFKKYHPKKGKNLSESTLQKIKAEILSRYPSYDYPNFVENGLQETGKNLAE